MDAGTKPGAGEDAKSIVVTRQFDAPRELVFAAWCDPEHISEWWGPYGFTTTTSAFDFRPGGEWRFVMHGPDGTNYANHVVYEEIVRTERVVYRRFDSDGNDAIHFRDTVTFEERDGGTLLTLRLDFAARELRDRAADMGAIEGGHQTLERLAAYLAES